MKRLVAGIVIGILIGSVAGRLALLLPPVWSVVFAFVLSLAVSFWALSSMRELDRRKRVIDEMLAKAAADRTRSIVDEVIAKFAPPTAKEHPLSRKDFGPPLQ